MKSASQIILGLVAVLVLSAASAAEILKIVVDDTIQPVTQEYIARAIDEAQRHNDQAVLIEIDTPGGLVDSTRRIIDKITSSQVPVIVYVAQVRPEFSYWKRPMWPPWLREPTPARRIPC